MAPEFPEMGGFLADLYIQLSMSDKQMEYGKGVETLHNGRNSVQKP